jgi:hypothetical protein
MNGLALPANITFLSTTRVGNAGSRFGPHLLLLLLHSPSLCVFACVVWQSWFLFLYFNYICTGDRPYAGLLEESRVERSGSVGWLRVLPTGRVAKLSNRWLHPFVWFDILARPVHYNYYYYFYYLTLSCSWRSASLARLGAVSLASLAKSHGRHNAIYELILFLLFFFGVGDARDYARNRWSGGPRRSGGRADFRRAGLPKGITVGPVNVSIRLFGYNVGTRLFGLTI